MEVFMIFFNRQICGRSLLLATVMVIGTIFTTNAFAQTFVSKDRFNELLQYAQNNSNKISASSLYIAYADNSHKFELDYKGKVFIITGIVTVARTGFFGDYVVELKTVGNNVNVVYPKAMSNTEMQRFQTFQQGDRFEALVSGRSTYSYVDVICYTENNSAYTATLRYGSGNNSGNNGNIGSNRNSNNSIAPSEEYNAGDALIESILDLFK
jgi:hypothetical protein